MEPVSGGSALRTAVAGRPGYGHQFWREGLKFGGMRLVFFVLGTNKLAWVPDDCAQVASDIRPEPELRAEYIERNPVTTVVQVAPELSEHEVRAKPPGHTQTTDEHSPPVSAFRKFATFRHSCDRAGVLCWGSGRGVWKLISLGADVD